MYHHVETKKKRELDLMLCTPQPAHALSELLTRTQHLCYTYLFHYVYHSNDTKPPSSTPGTFNLPLEPHQSIRLYEAHGIQKFPDLLQTALRVLQRSFRDFLPSFQGFAT
jgi:hypothetical protein